MRDGSWYMRSMPRHVVHEPGGVTSAIAVDDVLEIGRDAASGLVLGDAKASRHHATIRRDGEGWIVCDAESRHGTFVNGERIALHVLRDGDQLQIGATRMVFEQVEDHAGGALHLGTSALGSGGRLREFYQLAEATAAVAHACATFGGLDVLVSNAGGVFQGGLHTEGGRPRPPPSTVEC